MRILVVKLSSLGDVIHALPAVHELRTRLDATVDWVTQPEYVELVRACPDVKRVIAFPRRRFAAGARAFLGELRRDAYDIAIDLQGLLKSAIVVRLSRAKLRVGPRSHREGAGLLYSRVAGQPRGDRHAVDTWLSLVDDLAPGACPAPQFRLEMPYIPPPTDRPIVAISPFSRWDTKNWPIERFADVAGALAEQDNADIVVVGGQRDRDAAGGIAHAAGRNGRNLAGETSLVQLAAVLQQADTVITNDSGPMHVAAALGTPVVALFGPTHPERTGPYGDAHRVLTADRSCRPCFRRQCTRDRVCMLDITTEMVLDAARAMLANCPSCNAVEERTSAHPPPTE